MSTRNRLASLLSMGGLTPEAKERLEAIVADDGEDAVEMAEAARPSPPQAAGQRPRVGVVRDGDGFIVPARPAEARVAEVPAAPRARPVQVAAESRPDAAVPAIPAFKEEHKMTLATPTAPAAPAADKLPAVSAEPAVPCSVLSADAHFTRDGIESKGDFTVEGTFEGKITCRTLTVLSGGNVQGEVYVQTLKSWGTVTGQVVSDTVLLYKGSSLTGEIKCQSFGAQPDTVIRARIDCERGMQSMDATTSEGQREPANVGRRERAVQAEADFDLGGRVAARA